MVRKAYIVREPNIHHGTGEPFALCAIRFKRERNVVHYYFILVNAPDISLTSQDS